MTVTSAGRRPAADVARSRPVLRAIVAGAIAGAVGLALSELLAGLVPGIPSLVIAVGSLVIALQPPGAKDVMTSLFGTNESWSSTSRSW